MAEINPILFWSVRVGRERLYRVGSVIETEWEDGEGRCCGDAREEGEHMYCTFQYQRSGMHH